MSNRDVLLHKADLLAALHGEGKPVEIAHAVRLVREMRQSLAAAGAEYASLFDAMQHPSYEEENRLRAELAALRAQEPVGQIVMMDDGAHIPAWTNGTPDLYTKLYAAPAPAAVPDVIGIVHESVKRALDEVGIRADVQRGMALEVAIDKAQDMLTAAQSATQEGKP